MNLFKRTTASVALVALVSGVFSTGVSAYDASEVAAANALVAKGIIKSVDNVSDFNLDATITRAEMAKVAANVAGIDSKSTCENKFADVSATTPNTWVCGYVEALLEKGLVSANANYNPNANISKSEATKLMLEAAGETVSYTNATWQADFVAHAVENGFVTSFSDYNTSADRGFVFGAASAVTTEEEDDILKELEGLLGDGDDTTTETPTDTTDTTPTMSGDDVLEVTLSADTAESATVPGAISGLPVASFDFTAGSEDITISSLVVKRTGLSSSTTLTGLAAFTIEGRASKAKNDSQENNTQATLTLSNGGVVVKAGETQTLTIVADVASETIANGAEFAIELLEVTASSSIEGVDNLVGNTMKVGGVDAATVTIKTDGTVSDVKVGDDSIEIFKFKVEGANDEDVILKSITFKGEGSVDEEDELSNYQLDFEGTIVASAEANGKYITFNLEEGLTIKEGQTERFKVLADVTSGVNEVIAFKIDKTLDVTAEGTKYGFGASVNIDAVDAADGQSGGINNLGDLTIDAGELTLSDMDAPADKIRADKDEVELGSIKVSNVSGASLELQSFAVNAVLSGGWFIDNGANGAGVDTILGTADDVIATANDGIQTPLSGEAAATLATVFENFEVEINGTSYELTEAGGVYSDTDLTVTLAEGVTDMVIVADTKKYVSAGTIATLTVTNIGTTGFKAVELQEDTAVSDITPSSLSFKDVEFITAGAALSSVPLADVTVVTGSNEIVANQFEVKAEEASLVEVDEVKVTVGGYIGGGVLAAEANKVVASVTLYKGSISDANKLDEQSGTKITAAGLVTFDGFKTKIEANQTETFLAVISVVDGIDSVAKVLTVDVTSVSATDDDGDDVVITGTALNNKTVTVTSAGSFTVAYDSNNEANEDAKTMLSGTSKVLASYDVQAQNEGADVETVVVTFNDGTNLSDTLLSARLLLDGTVVGTASNSDLAAAVLTFDDLTSLIIPTESQELEVEITTSTSGFEQVGANQIANFITSISLEDVTGEDSGKNVTLQTETTNSLTFNVVAGTILPSNVQSLSSTNTQAKIKLTVSTGDNKEALSNATPTATVNTLTFSTPGQIGIVAAGYSLYEEGESSDVVIGKLVSGNLVFDFNDQNGDATPGDVFANGSISSNKTYVIVPTIAAGQTASITLLQDGVNYTIEGATISTNLDSEDNFGSRTVAN